MVCLPYKDILKELYKDYCGEKQEKKYKREKFINGCYWGISTMPKEYSHIEVATRVGAGTVGRVIGAGLLSVLFAELLIPGGKTIGSTIADFPKYAAQYFPQIQENFRTAKDSGIIYALGIPATILAFKKYKGIWGRAKENAREAYAKRKAHTKVNLQHTAIDAE